MRKQKVPDLFLRLRRSIDEEDRNYIFIQEVKRASDAIIYRLQRFSNENVRRLTRP